MGVTAEEMLQKKKNKEFMQSYYTRASEVRAFLDRMKVKHNVFDLHDGYGVAITLPEITALIVTKETQ